LDVYGIRLEEVREVLQDAAISVAEGMSRPDPESVARRVLGNREVIVKAVASWLLERGSLDSESKIEFIVSNAPEVAGRAAPRIYYEASSRSLGHVIDSLRDLWLAYGNPTPVVCPRCRFNSVTPDLHCMVCGSSLGEDEVKEANGFAEKLRVFGEREREELVEEAIASGMVYLDHEIRPPSMRGKGYALPLYLSRRERLLLASILRSRRGSSGSRP